MPTVRPALNDEYVRAQAVFLARARGISVEKATAFVREVAKTRFKDRDMHTVAVKPNGDAHVAQTTLYSFIETARSHVLTPNGCIYLRSDETESHTSRFVKAGLDNRKKAKKEMLKAEAVGDSVLARQKNYTQASCKILLNSLPGGMGEPHNIFYDKGGYNAITALARSLIATSYTVVEQTFGGNFAWYNEDEIINYLLVNVQHCPKDAIAPLVQKHHLHVIVHDELLAFLLTCWKPYRHPRHTDDNLRAVVKSFTPVECTYLYYLGNLKHLIMDQREENVAIIRRAFEYSGITGDGVDPESLYKLNDSLMAMVTPQFVGKLNGMQVYDLPKKDPELAKLYVACAKHTELTLSHYREMFESLVYSPANIPRVNIKQYMVRNTVIISDTDSEFSTAVHWSNWYCGDSVASAEAYQITGVMIYWLTDCASRELTKWSVKHGCSDVDKHRMNMKNEFLYPAIILYDTKKTYAGIQSVREGVVLPKPKVDIKGGKLRSSNLCKRTLDFTNTIIADVILKPSLRGQISGTDLIRRIADYESGIRASLAHRETEYLKMVSVGEASRYKKVEQSIYMYWVTWTMLFAEEHGQIVLPTKASVVPLLPPTPEFMSALKEKHPKVYDRWVEYRRKFNKHPTGVLVEVSYGQIPEAILPLVNIRNVIYFNLSPVYATVEPLGIPVLHKKRKLLFDDLYNDEE